MFQNLDVFRMADAMARHAGKRQALTARNLANADTPGYKAQDLQPFSETLKPGSGFTAQRASRPLHLNGDRSGATAIKSASVTTDSSAPSDPNGNSVAIEGEILRGVEAKRQHDQALAIYRSSLTILRTALGRA